MKTSTQPTHQTLNAQSREKSYRATVELTHSANFWKALQRCWTIAEPSPRAELKPVRHNRFPQTPSSDPDENQKHVKTGKKKKRKNQLSSFQTAGEKRMVMANWGPTHNWETLKKTRSTNDRRSTSINIILPPSHLPPSRWNMRHNLRLEFPQCNSLCCARRPLRRVPSSIDPPGGWFPRAPKSIASKWEKMTRKNPAEYVDSFQKPFKHQSRRHHPPDSPVKSRLGGFSQLFIPARKYWKSATKWDCE